MSLDGLTKGAFITHTQKKIHSAGGPKEGGGRGGISVTHTGCGQAPLTAFLHETTGKDR